MKFTLDLTALEIKSEGPGTSLSLPQFLQNLSPFMPFDSGLIPCSGDGVIAIRKGFGFEQFVYQRKAGVYKVKWGTYERDASATVHELAHPFRVIIADFQDGNLLGVRHFYSPYPIVSLNDPLYCVNLPNTNTTGYNGTSVGWTCLYRTGDTTKYTPAQRILYAIEREGGLSEPYNDANMSSTDGPRFYQKKGRPSYMYDKLAWEKKTKAEGFDWICSEDELIPMLVKEKTNASTYDPSGTPYTLARAIYEPYSAYYHDKTYTKPINKIHQEGWTSADALFWSSPVMKALNAGGGTATLGQVPKKVAPPAPKTLADAAKIFDEKAKISIPQNLLLFTKEGYICENCHQHNSYVDGNPTPVYRALGPLKNFYSAETGEWTIKDIPMVHDPVVGSPYYWDDLSDLDWENKILFQLIGEFGTTCNCVAANTHCYHELTKNGLNSHTYIHVFQDSFVWSLSGDELLLKVRSTHCEFCDSWMSNENGLVYDFVPGSKSLGDLPQIDATVLSPCGCTTCFNADNYLPSVRFVDAMSLVTVQNEAVKPVAPSLEHLASVPPLNITLDSLRASGAKFYTTTSQKAQLTPDLLTLKGITEQIVFTYFNYPPGVIDHICPCGLSFEIEKDKNVTSDGPVCPSCNDHGVFYPFFNRIK